MSSTLPMTLRTSGTSMNAGWSDASTSAADAAAARPVSGSATASATNTGGPAPSSQSPPATAASSPNPTRPGCSIRPWPVIDTHDVPDRSSSSTGSTPRLATARGRDASMTRSAAASNRNKNATSSGADRSMATDSLPALRRSKNGRGPLRAPSGRSRASTLTTRAPASSKRDAASGPAHSADRSTTSGRSPARRRRTGLRAMTRLGDATGGCSLGRAIANPSSVPRATSSSTESAVINRRVVTQSSGSTVARSRAGNRSRSDRRGRLSTTHPSAPRSKRAKPPTDTDPLRSKPAMAARSPSSAGPSTSTRFPKRAVIAATSSAAERAATATPDGSGRGDPPG